MGFAGDQTVLAISSLDSVGLSTIVDIDFRELVLVICRYKHSIASTRMPIIELDVEIRSGEISDSSG